MGPTRAHPGPVGPRWAPCWPHQGSFPVDLPCVPRSTPLDHSNQSLTVIGQYDSREASLRKWNCWGLVTHIRVCELVHHWFKWCILANTGPSHYMPQCLSMKHMGTIPETEIFFQENAFALVRESKADLWCFFVVSLNKMLKQHSIDR